MNNENNNVVPTPQENNGMNISPMPNVDNSQTVQPVPNVFTNQPAQPVNDIPVQTVNNVEPVQPVENVVPVQPANEVVSQPTVSESFEQINIGESVNPVPPVQESQVQPIVEQQPIGSQQVLNSEEVKVVDSKPEEPKNDTISQTVQSFYNEPKKKKSKAVPFLVFIILLLCLGIVAMYLYYNGHLDKYIGGSTTNNSVEQKDNSKSSDKEDTTTSNESGVNTSKLSEEAALKLGNELWKYVYDLYWGEKTVCAEGSSAILKKISSDFKWTWSNDIELDKLDDSFIRTHCNNPAGRGSTYNYVDTKLNIKSNNENVITFLATSNYCICNSDKQEGYFCKENCTDYEKKEKDFIIKKVDGEWKISQFYLPN